MNVTRFFTLVALISTLPTFVGCGGGPKLVPVQGQISYPDGSPVKAGKLVFIPANNNDPSPIAEIGSDGSYEAYTNNPGDGVQLGTYKVGVLPPGDDYGAKNPLPIDQKFSDPELSGFSITVEDKTNKCDFTVTRPGGKR